MRLAEIFSDGTPDRAFVTREIAANTVFTLLYLGAVEGNEYFAKPDQVVRMTDGQSMRRSDEARLEWRDASVRRGGGDGGWYAKNTRESIRDETLRRGLIAHGAALERTDLPTTSPHGRYALTSSFARLFDPDLSGPLLDAAIHAWQAKHLSPDARARTTLLRRKAVGSTEGLLVTFPNGETRRLSPGLSSEIAKEVIEVFAQRFLRNAGVLWLSESANKESFRDASLLAALGISIDVGRLLPDIILVDLGNEGDAPVFVFLEVVATDGAMTIGRRAALTSLLIGSGYRADQARFVTAYRDREHRSFRSTAASLAWGSVAWFVSEPDHLMILTGPSESTYLADLA